jgi:hypothetical protein
VGEEFFPYARLHFFQKIPSCLFVWRWVNSGMSATEVIAEIKALPDEERDRVLNYLVADAELRQDLQDSMTIEARRHEASRPLADVLNDLDLRA